MLTFLYTLIIYPPIQIIELAFQLFDKIFKNMSIAVLGVSGTVTLLCLPLYIIAEKWQEKERDTQKLMLPMVNNIKSVYKGDERFMLLQEFYRQNRYHPLYALRSSFGILIQIPFFIAAYSYLSHLEALQGVSFLFIRNLGAPDAFGHIGPLTINILPVLMTCINIGSGILYSRGFPLKDKVQLYIIAAVFLVLLYNSPAGLVIYWTMNNILSLIKNIFYKLKNPLKTLYIISVLVILSFIFYMVFINNGVINKRLFIIAGSALFLFTPLYVKFFNYFHRKFLPILTKNPQRMTILFMAFSFGLALLVGLCIPSAVISSSPEEFSFIDNYTTPLVYLGYSLLAALGIFSFWPVCVYFLFGKRIRSLLTAFFGVALFTALINTFVFKGNYGVLTNVYQFSTTAVLSSSLLFSVVNGLATVAIILLFVFLLKKRLLSLIVSASLIIAISLSVFSIYNIFRIQQGFINLEARRKNETSITSLDKVFHLSRDKPNLIIMMADCSINGYVKPVFDARPELYDDFDGFTIYRNTLSFAGHTLMGCPPIWGGFEYTPLEMDKRDTIPLKDKHNQALLTLPAILSKDGYDVTVTDPSQANYQWISDNSIYDGMKNVTAFNTIGRYTSYWFQEHHFGDIPITANTIKRNSLFFSLLKIVPPAFRFVIYDKGHYWAGATESDSINFFVDNYAVLDYLPELTAFDAQKSQALLITNELTHQLNFLQYPDYIPVPVVTDKGPGEYNTVMAYHANAALLISLSRWLRELKTEGVYNNTRIIIVADHGAPVDAHISDTPIPVPGERRESYNPLLLVKDFNSHGKLKENYDFMTNADVPVLALKDIVSNPVSPFSGNPINSDYKTGDGIYLTINHKPMVADHGKYKFNIRPDQWVHVKGDMRDANNWELAVPPQN